MNTQTACSSAAMTTPSRKRPFQLTGESEQQQHRPHARYARPPPRTPFPWVWNCHKCFSEYRFSAALNRCLSCSHRFCRKCVSEYDYDGWDQWKAYWVPETEEGFESPLTATSEYRHVDADDGDDEQEDDDGEEEEEEDDSTAGDCDDEDGCPMDEDDDEVDVERAAWSSRSLNGGDSRARRLANRRRRRPDAAVASADADMRLQAAVDAQLTDIMEEEEDDDEDRCYILSGHSLLMEDEAIPHRRMAFSPTAINIERSSALLPELDLATHSINKENIRPSLVRTDSLPAYLISIPASQSDMPMDVDCTAAAPASTNPDRGDRANSEPPASSNGRIKVSSILEDMKAEYRPFRSTLLRFSARKLAGKDFGVNRLWRRHSLVGKCN